MTKFNLGIAYANMNRFADAVPLFKAASEGFKRAFGADHPKARHSTFQFGRCLAAVKRHEEAIPPYEQCSPCKSGCFRRTTTRR